MSTEEKALSAFKALPMYEAEAKERQRAAGTQFGRGMEKDVPIVEQAIPEPKSIERAASAFGVGKQYIADIKRIEKEAPETFKKIEQGKITIPEAKREVAATKEPPPYTPPKVDWKDVAAQLKTALACIVHANNPETQQIAIEQGARLLVELRG